MKISVLTYNFLKIKYLGLFFFGIFIQLNAQEASNSRTSYSNSLNSLSAGAKSFAV